MAELKCGVENCTYNKDKYCSKGDIMVGGKHAVRALSRNAKALIQAPWIIHVKRSVSIVRQQSVYTILIISAMQSM